MNFFFEQYPSHWEGKYSRYDQAFTGIEDLFVFLGHPDKTDLKQLQKHSVLNFYKKNAVLIGQGKAADRLFYISSGGVRIYKKTGKNEEQTLLLLSEGNLITSIDDFLNNAPSAINIVATEDTYVIEFTFNDFQKLTKSMDGFMPAILKAFSKVILFQQRHIEILKATAAVKFQYLKKYEHIMRAKFQSKHQASFLGIEPETFSRIKTKQANNKY